MAQNEYSQIIQKTILDVLNKYHNSGDEYLTKRLDEIKRIRNNLINAPKDVKLMYELYEEVTKVSNYLQTGQEKSSLNYSLYYIDDKNKVYRINKDNIPFEAIGESDSQLRIKESYLKEIKDQIKGQENLQKHFQRFYNTLGYTYKGKTFPNRSINRGVIAEAFERHLVNIHNGSYTADDYSQLHDNYDWTVSDAWELIHQSKGSSAFYRGGDVQDFGTNTQVKEITAKGGHVRLARFSTLINISDEIIKMLDTNNKPKNLDKKASLFLEQLVKDDGDAIDKLATKTGLEMAVESLSNAEDIIFTDKNSVATLRKQRNLTS